MKARHIIRGSQEKNVLTISLECALALITITVQCCQNFRLELILIFRSTKESHGAISSIYLQTKTRKYITVNQEQ